MTPLFLQDALAAELEEALKDLRPGGKAYTVHKQHLPPRKADGDDTIYPFCRVALGDGDDSGEESLQDVVLVLAVRDTAGDMQGYRDLLNAVQRIRERFRRDPVLAGQFEAAPRIRWAFSDDITTHPVYYGAVLMQFRLPGMDVVSENI